MVHVNRFFVVVAALHSLVSNSMHVKATSTVLHINNFTSLVFGKQVTLLCDVNSTDNRMINAVKLSRMIKTKNETIVRWSSGAWEQFVPNGRNWTVTIDNNTYDIQLEIQDFSNMDSGQYYCITSDDKYSQQNWLNLTRTEQFESEEKTDNDDILQSLPSKLGLCFGLVGMLSMFAGLLVAYWKRRFWLPKLVCGRNQDSSQIESIPFVHRVISDIICIVEKNGLDTEGIYRLSSPQWELAKARQEILKDVNAVQSLPVITLCNVLKTLIRELATPLINETAVQDLLRANACTTESEKCTMMKSVLQLLDITHFECLRDILLHLRRVSAHSAINKMTVENLAIVFAPSLLRTVLSYNHLEISDAINAATEENNLKSQVIALLIKTL